MKRFSIAIVMLLGSSIVNAVSPPITEKQLGQLLFTDKNLSLDQNVACATCHSPQLLTIGSQTAAGWVDPANVKNSSPVSAGSVSGEFGTLNAPSTAYAVFSPAFYFNPSTGQYVGGQFWDGRAVNLAAQAEGPLLNPAEMAMPSQWAVVNRLQANGTYVQAFQVLYGSNISNIPVFNPKVAPPAIVATIYGQLAQAISVFEQTQMFSLFNSKFDFVLAGKTSLTPLEAQGRALFEGKANCSVCHSSALIVQANGVKSPPLFSNYQYYNIGVPVNLNIPNNPAPNLGLGGRADIQQEDLNYALQIGKHKTMSLRNIAVTPPYAHNGIFVSLAQIVHFLNTRDTLGSVATNQSPGFGVTGWAPPEIPENVNVTMMGSLSLKPAEEQALVAFLKTLTDDYPTWGNDPKVPPGSLSPFAPIKIP